MVKQNLVQITLNSYELTKIHYLNLFTIYYTIFTRINKKKPTSAGFFYLFKLASFSFSTSSTSFAISSFILSTHGKLSQIGNFLPKITFDFKSSNLSISHLIEAATKILIVSWKEAADNQLSVDLAKFVSHITNLSPLGGCFHNFSNSLIIFV